MFVQMDGIRLFWNNNLREETDEYFLLYYLKFLLQINFASLLNYFITGELFYQIICLSILGWNKND